MTQIKSPNPDYDGVSLGVQFSQGVGETDDATKIAWFQEHGYTVETGTVAPTSSVNDTEFASEYGSAPSNSTQGFASSNASEDAEFANEVGSLGSVSAADAVNAFSSSTNDAEFASELNASESASEGIEAQGFGSEERSHSKKHKK